MTVGETLYVFFLFLAFAPRALPPMKMVHAPTLVFEQLKAGSCTDGFPFCFSVYLTHVKVVITVCSSLCKFTNLDPFSCNLLLCSLPTPVDTASLNLLRNKAHYTVYVCVYIYFFLWCCGPTRVMASSFLKFIDHTRQHTKVSRTPPDE